MTIDRVLVAILIGSVRAYQLTVRGIIGASCRYQPSCSAYAIGAWRVHGGIRGSMLAARRLLRCTPWHGGGQDPVPDPDPVSPG